MLGEQKNGKIIAISSNDLLTRFDVDIVIVRGDEKKHFGVLI